MHAFIHKSGSIRRFSLVVAVALLALSMDWSAAVAGDPLKKGQIIEPSAIRDAVKRFIVQNAPWDSKQMQIRDIRFKQTLRLPSGPVTLQVASPKHNDWIGATPFHVKVLVAGQRVKRITVPANIEVWSDVVVTAKPLGKYQPINQDDIRTKRMNLARVPSNVVVRMDQALGRRANRNIAADCILRMDQIEIPPVVRRGDVVRIVAQTPMLKITVKGMAKQDGVKGERIKVINLRSKKLIYAQVMDNQTVQVDF